MIFIIKIIQFQQICEYIQQLRTIKNIFKTGIEIFDSEKVCNDAFEIKLKR